VSALPFDVQRLRRALAGRARFDVALSGFAAAAVLVPVFGAPEQLLFTERRHDLPTHAGQISFPGGKRDASDADAAATAVRETREELGIAPDAVEIIGLLDDVPTPTGFVITPVVARLHTAAWTPNPAEVASVFAADLDALVRCHAIAGTRSFAGVQYEMHEYQWQAHRIWGATARIVHQLLTLLTELQ
jgi:8-oxo-dGTP pyrophosphatase MutT (NUDIX family)